VKLAELHNNSLEWKNDILGVGSKHTPTAWPILHIFMGSGPLQPQDFSIPGNPTGFPGMLKSLKVLKFDARVPKVCMWAAEGSVHSTALFYCWLNQWRSVWWWRGPQITLNVTSSGMNITVKCFAHYVTSNHLKWFIGIIILWTASWMQKWLKVTQLKIAPFEREHTTSH